MAKFDGKYFSGPIGRVIFRKHRGQQVVYQKCLKDNIAQTEKTVKASKVFGKASRLTSCIRMLLMKLTLSNFDSNISNRLIGEVTAILNGCVIPETPFFEFVGSSFQKLIGFELNIKSPFKSRFFSQPTIYYANNLVQIVLPEMLILEKIKFPRGISDCKIVISMSELDLRNGKYSNADVQVIDLHKVNEHSILPQQQITFSTEPGTLCIIGICLQFYEATYLGNNLVNTKAFSPAAILNAYYLEGNVNKENTSDWHDFHFKNEVPILLPAIDLPNHTAA